MRHDFGREQSTAVYGDLYFIYRHWIPGYATVEGRDSNMLIHQFLTPSDQLLKAVSSIYVSG